MKELFRYLKDWIEWSSFTDILTLVISIIFFSFTIGATITLIVYMVRYLLGS